MDGVYWTLFIEVQFYVIAAAAYFFFRRTPLLFTLGVLMNLSLVLVHLPFVSADPVWVADTKTWTLSDYLPLFVSGAAFFSLSRHRHRLVAAVMVGESLAILLARTHLDPTLGFIFCVFFLLFVSLIYWPKGVAVFTWPPLVAIGASSYALYLLHNRIGVSLSYNLAVGAPAWLRDSPLIPLGVAVTLVMLSYQIFQFWEVPARRVIVGWGSRALRATRRADGRTA